MYTTEPFSANINDIISEENLGIYLELTEQYVKQDTQLYKINSKIFSSLPKSDIPSFTEKLEKFGKDLELLESKILKVKEDAILSLEKIDKIRNKLLF